MNRPFMLNERGGSVASLPPRMNPKEDRSRIARLEAFVYRAPVDTPVQTSFGIMRDRPAVFVRVTDTDGVQGWGEIWCNFPTVGAEHRARLVDAVFAPLAQGKTFASPETAFL